MKGERSREREKVNKSDKRERESERRERERKCGKENLFTEGERKWKERERVW